MPNCLKKTNLSLRVRRATRADIPAMWQLHRESSTSAWSHGHYENLFGTAAPEQAGYFTLVAEDSTELRSVAESSPCSLVVAHLVAHHVLDEWQLQYTVVARSLQRRGVGSYLLKEFISHVKRTGGSRILLEVRESNEIARHLYHALGFRKTGLRKGYYSDPPEDAILYELNLNRTFS
jgi:[ribosomal protein S18]-alanine N-acetyltransferase